MLGEFITSRLLGQPTELFRFVYGPLPQDVALYTDSDKPVVYLGETYSPVSISRSSTSNSGTLDKTAIEVMMPHLLKLPQLFRIYPPSGFISLTILQGQARDPDAQFVAVWVGRVISISVEGIEAKLSAEPITTSFRRAGLRRNYQYMCPHVLYGPQCKASKSAATTSATVLAVSGRTVVLSGAVPGQSLYAGGMIEWASSGGAAESRTIVSVSSSGGNTSLLLTGLVPGLTAGKPVSLVLGCQHTLTACIAQHNNAPNFGGHPWIPLKNPIGNVSPYQ